MADQAANLALVINEAGRLSDMADKVAGFAISSNLVLVFACLKDIGAWVKTETAAFLIGTSAGGCIYIAAVWWLYFREISVQSGGLPIEDLSLLDSVSWSLVWARTFGIAAFTIIAALAVWGTRRGL